VHQHEDEEHPRPARERTPTPHDRVLALQASAGNQAVTGMLARRVIAFGGTVSDVEFTVGKEISAALATAAKRAAPGGIKPDELARLRTVALGDGTITDDERMFLAGLLEPSNAALVAAMETRAGAAVTFSVGTIQPHMGEIRDLGRPTVDPEVTKELNAAYDEYFTNFNPHMRAARDAAIKQIHALAGRDWRRQADTLISMSTLWAGETLRAMVAAASDSTPGDMVMAGAVYIVAARASHPLADDVKAGRIKVDQLPGPAPGGEFASYSASGGDDKSSKGDTIYVHADLDITNLAHRRAIIHELEHAADDKSTQAGHWRTTRRDDAEIRAYRAGARYTLRQLEFMTQQVQSAVTLGDEKSRKLAQAKLDKAYADVGAQAHAIHMLSMALEARADLKRFEMIVVAVDSAAPPAARAPNLVQLLRGPEAAVEAQLRDVIQDVYKLKTPAGTLDPVKNTGRFDAQSGEGVLDTAALPRQQP
jgi:hypothetical protein